MITFNHVTFTYPGAESPALREVTLNVPSDQLILVLGESGSGKSTLLRCINGLIPHFSGGVLHGTIRVLGLDPVLATPREMSRQVGFVFQDPEAQFVVDRVEDEIAFALENAAVQPPEMKRRINEVITLLGLENLRHRHIDTLSGGERQKVAIAAVLALRPRLLLLDEPTSQLDPQSADDLLETLVRLNSQLNLGVVIAEHRLERILPYVDWVVHLKGGMINIASDDVRQSLESIQLDSPLISLGKALDWHPLPLSVEEARRIIEKSPWIQNISVSIRNNRDGHKKHSPYLECNHLQVLYNGKKALDDVNLALYPGEIVFLLGENGAGKTTLLRSLVGLIRPQVGSVKLLGQDISNMEVAEICRKVGYLPQDPNALLFADSVREELMITLRNHQCSLPPSWQETLLNQLGLSALADSYPRDLSVGERQRVALAAIMITQPGALLLDEPTRGMDYQAKHHLLDILQHFRSEGKAILLATHDVELAAAAADRVVLIEHGKIIADGSPHEVLANSPKFAPQIARLFPGTGWLTPSDVVRNLSQVVLSPQGISQ
jgi:energy-coupling factor transporter ATP-binding protein EcfA2